MYFLPKAIFLGAIHSPSGEFLLWTFFDPSKATAPCSKKLQLSQKNSFEREQENICIPQGLLFVALLEQRQTTKKRPVEPL